MANQVGNSNNPGNFRSRFDTNKLGPNGAMPTRNGIKGQSIGRIVRTDFLPQDKVEITQETIQKSTAQKNSGTAAQTQVFSATPVQTAQIQTALYAFAQAVPEEVLQAHQLPDNPVSLSVETQALSSVGDSNAVSLKDEFIQFATDIVNGVVSGDAEQFLNLFMDVHASRTGWQLENGRWFDRNTQQYVDDDIIAQHDYNSEFESFMWGIVDGVSLADPNRLTSILASWFGSGLAGYEGESWHNWTPSGDFAGFTRDELNSAVANVLTNAGLSLNHIELTEDGATLNGGGELNENFDTQPLWNSVQNLFREMIAETSPSITPPAGAVPPTTVAPTAPQVPPISPYVPPQAFVQATAPQADTQATSQATQAASQTGTSGASQVAGTGQTGGGKTAQDVLDMLREMMPGWVIATGNANWQPGFRNIQIDHELLERMANDPAEMERILGIIRDIEELVPKLEQWAEENPGKSLILNFFVDADGNISGFASLRTLLGLDGDAEFDLSGDRTSWLENLLQTVGALTEESRSWTA